MTDAITALHLIKCALNVTLMVILHICAGEAPNRSETIALKASPKTPVSIKSNLNRILNLMIKLLRITLILVLSQAAGF